MSKYMLARPLGLAQAGTLADLVCESPVIKQILFFLYCFFISWMRVSEEDGILQDGEMCFPVWPMLVEILIWL